MVLNSHSGVYYVCTIKFGPTFKQIIIYVCMYNTLYLRSNRDFIRIWSNRYYVRMYNKVRFMTRSARSYWRGSGQAWRGYSPKFSEHTVPRVVRAKHRLFGGDLIFFDETREQFCLIFLKTICKDFPLIFALSAIAMLCKGRSIFESLHLVCSILYLSIIFCLYHDSYLCRLLAPR